MAAEQVITVGESASEGPSSERYERHEAQAKNLRGFDWDVSEDEDTPEDRSLLSWRKEACAGGKRT
jgi:hypothetical protein